MSYYKFREHRTLFFPPFPPQAKQNQTLGVLDIWSESSKHTEQHVKRLYYNALLMVGQICRFKEWEEYKYEWSRVWYKTSKGR